jgi:hypothetical protein
MYPLPRETSSASLPARTVAPADEYTFWILSITVLNVIQGYLPLLAREAHIVYWFREVQGVYPVTTKALKKRTEEYRT